MKGGTSLCVLVSCALRRFTAAYLQLALVYKYVGEIVKRSGRQLQSLTGLKLTRGSPDAASNARTLCKMVSVQERPR